MLQIIYRYVNRHMKTRKSYCQPCYSSSSSSSSSEECYYVCSDTKENNPAYIFLSATVPFEPLPPLLPLFISPQTSTSLGTKVVPDTIESDNFGFSSGNVVVKKTGVYSIEIDGSFQLRTDPFLATYSAVSVFMTVNGEKPNNVSARSISTGTLQTIPRLSPANQVNTQFLQTLTKGDRLGFWATRIEGQSSDQFVTASSISVIRTILNDPDTTILQPWYRVSIHEI